MGAHTITIHMTELMVTLLTQSVIDEVPGVNYQPGDG
jgi:hypothetical protein